MKLISYLDYGNNDIIKDLEIFIDLNLAECIITQYNGVPIDLVSSDDVLKLSEELKLQKIKVYGLELNNFDNKDYENTFNDLKNKVKLLIDYAKTINTKQVIFTLPYIENILNDYEIIKSDLESLIELARVNKIFLKFKQGENKNSTVTYLLKHLKYREFGLLFEPAQIYRNEESVIVANRLYKHFLNNILIEDLDSVGNPELIGYGKVGLIDLFRRMNRDKFKGDIILSPNFKIYFEKKTIDNDKKKVPLLKKIFTRKPKAIDYLIGFGERIFPGENKKPTITELYESQISAIKKIFNLR